MATPPSPPTNQIQLPIRSLLVQTLQFLTGEANVEVSLPCQTTPAQVLKAAAEATQNNNSAFFLLKNRMSPEVSRRMWECATRQPLTPLTFRVNHNIPLPDLSQTPRRQINQETLRRMVQRAEAVIDRDPYAISFEARVIEGSLIALPSAGFIFAGIEAGIDEPVSHVIDALCIWDTGCHVTTLSEDILSEDFLIYIKDPTYAHHQITQSGESWLVAMDGYLSFSNTNLQISFVARVVPRERMPNGFRGILIGQIAVIDSLEYRAIPRAIMGAAGSVVEDNVWGELVLHKFFDANTGEVKTL